MSKKINERDRKKAELILRVSWLLVKPEQDNDQIIKINRRLEEMGLQVSSGENQWIQTAEGIRISRLSMNLLKGDDGSMLPFEGRKKIFEEIEKKPLSYWEID